MYKFILIVFFSLILICVKNYSQGDSILEIKELLIQSYDDDQYYSFKTTIQKFKDKDFTPLGIRYFNFGCIKTRMNGFYQGQTDKDIHGHAIFSDPFWGIYALVELCIRFYKEGYDTPLLFISRYAPSDGCIGDLKDKNGKCKIGPNPTGSYVKRLIKELSIEENKKMPFYENEKISIKCLSHLIAVITHFELGVFLKKYNIGKTCKLSDEVIENVLQKIENNY